MAEVVAIPVVNFSVNANPYLDTYPAGAIQKFKKNRSRRKRRQRNRLKYVQKLRQLRIRRRTEDQLCAAVSFFDISDMENPSQNYISHPPKEVTEWQYNHQLAYWKSRAVSLEYENHMLKQHIKSYYTEQIENHNKCIQDQELDASQDDINTTSQSEVEVDNTCHEQKTEKHEELYGHMAPKINGMETAMQVSYNLQVDRSNPPYWPNLPLNL